MNSLHKLSICIIGSNGFLSNAIAKYANNQGWALTIFGRNPNNEINTNTFINIDLMHEDVDYNALMSSDVIIYAVGAGIQSNLEESKEQIYKLNTFVPTTICNNLVNANYKGTFISFGSFFEIGESNKRNPFTEDEILCSAGTAPSDYIVSKRMMSRFVASYRHNFKHWHFIIPTIYGEFENPARLIPYTIKSLKNGKNPQFTAGDQIRQYLYVDEVPEMIESSILNNLSSGVYNLQGRETLSIKQLVSIIYSYFGKDLQIECFGSASRTDIHMKYLALNGEKLYKAIGFKAKTEIKNVIEKYNA